MGVAAEIVVICSLWRTRMRIRAEGEKEIKKKKRKKKGKRNVQEIKEEPMSPVSLDYTFSPSRYLRTYKGILKINPKRMNIKKKL